MADEQSAVLLERYVGNLRTEGAIRSERVQKAFLRVKRHRFLKRWYSLRTEEGSMSWDLVAYDPDKPDPESLAMIYSDRSIVTRVEGPAPVSSISQPSLVARMLELARVGREMRVMEIGTGTGYNAALLAEVTGDSSLVYSVESHSETGKEAREILQRQGYKDIHVFCRDGFYGAPEGAPYDRIEATVGCTDLSPRWLDQLSPEGLLLVPLAHGCAHPLIRLAHDSECPEHAQGEVVGWSSFIPIEGVLSWVDPWQSFLLPEVERQSRWKRSLPSVLPKLGDATHPINDPTHRAFYFSLTLWARELWYTDQGYGLSDPGAGVVVVIVGDGIVGYYAAGGENAAERLYGRLCECLDRWKELGCPAPDDYKVRFVPKKDFPKRRNGDQRTEIIPRVYFWELVYLP